MTALYSGFSGISAYVLLANQRYLPFILDELWITFYRHVWLGWGLINQELRSLGGERGSSLIVKTPFLGHLM